MGIFQVTMKTHSREDITDSCIIQLNKCIVHKRKPSIFKMIVGKAKETYYTANCVDDDCGKIATTKNEVIEAWNKWNPKN